MEFVFPSRRSLAMLGLPPARAAPGHVLAWQPSQLLPLWTASAHSEALFCRVGFQRDRYDEAAEADQG
jgi:hypothetical protein